MTVDEILEGHTPELSDQINAAKAVFDQMLMDEYQQRFALATAIKSAIITERIRCTAECERVAKIYEPLNGQMEYAARRCAAFINGEDC